MRVIPREKGCGGEECWRRKVSIPAHLSDPQKQLTVGSVCPYKHHMESPGLRQFSRHIQWVVDKSTDDERGAVVPRE